MPLSNLLCSAILTLFLHHPMCLATADDGPLNSRSTARIRTSSARFGLLVIWAKQTGRRPTFPGEKFSCEEMPLAWYLADYTLMKPSSKQCSSNRRIFGRGTCLRGLSQHKRGNLTSNLASIMSRMLTMPTYLLQPGLRAMSCNPNPVFSFTSPSSRSI